MVTINVDVSLAGDSGSFQARLAQYVDRVHKEAREALDRTAELIAHNVLEITPVWTGGLQDRIMRREEDDGEGQIIYAEGVVARVHEGNPPAVWTRMPPRQPILDWVTGKLGLAGADASRAAYFIRKKILRRGLTLPNVEGRGMMFGRTFERMQATKYHFYEFANNFVQRASRAD